MKKMLSILASFGVATTSAATVVSCGINDLKWNNIETDPLYKKIEVEGFEEIDFDSLDFDKIPTADVLIKQVDELVKTSSSKYQKIVWSLDLDGNITENLDMKNKEHLSLVSRTGIYKFIAQDVEDNSNKAVFNFKVTKSQNFNDVIGVTNDSITGLEVEDNRPKTVLIKLIMKYMGLTSSLDTLAAQMISKENPNEWLDAKIVNTTDSSETVEVNFGEFGQVIEGVENPFWGKTTITYKNNQSNSELVEDSVDFDWNFLTDGKEPEDKFVGKVDEDKDYVVIMQFIIFLVGYKPKILDYLPQLINELKIERKGEGTNKTAIISVADKINDNKYKTLFKSGGSVEISYEK